MNEIDRLRESNQSLSGGGKNIKEIRAQVQRAVQTVNDMIAAASARGDRARVAALRERRDRIKQTGSRYVSNIRRLSEKQKKAKNDFKLASTNRGKAERALATAKTAHENAQKSGDKKQIAKTQRRLDKAQGRVDKANSTYSKAKAYQNKMNSAKYARSTYQNNGRTRYNESLINKTNIGGVGQFRASQGTSRARYINETNNALRKLGSNFRRTNGGSVPMGGGRIDKSWYSRLTYKGRFVKGSRPLGAEGRYASPRPGSRGITRTRRRRK